MTSVDRAEVSVKGRSNFVTDCDVAVQEFMKKGLRELYPDYAFFSEEHENCKDFDGPTWILDPIDGTANFIAHYRQSAISLGLWQEGGIVFGAVYNPFTEEMFTAERGKGAFLNGVPIRADGEVDFQNALIELGTMPYHKNRAQEVGRMATEIILRASDLRRSGSAALSLCCVAAGRTGGFLEGILQPWDYAAGSLIVEEAGALVTDWEGNPVVFNEARPVICAAPQLYDALMEMVRDVTA